MKRIAFSSCGLGLTLFAVACSSGVQIQTLSTPNATGVAAAATAAGEERDIGGRSARRLSVSVLPFDVTTTDSAYAPIGYGFADLLLTDLGVSHQLIVVDRMHNDELRRELSLSSQRSIDPATAVRLGRTIAAQDVVLGTLSLPQDSSLRFETNIADVASGGVASAFSGRGGVDQMFDAERQLVMKLFERFGVKLTPAELTKLDQSPRTSTKAFAAYSAGVRAESHGDLIAAQAAFDRAIEIDPKFVPAVEHRAAVLLRVPKQSGSAAANVAVSPNADASRLDAREDSGGPARSRATKSTPVGSASASVVVAGVGVPATAPGAAAAPATAPPTPVASSTSPAPTAASASHSASTVPTAATSLAPSAANTPPNTTSASTRPKAAAAVSALPKTGVRPKPGAGVSGPPLAKARRDSIAATRAARRDSIQAAVKQRADSMKAVREARTAARRDSVRNAAKMAAGKRPPGK